MTLPDGVVATYTSDAASQLTSLTHALGGYSHRKIAERLQAGSYSTVSSGAMLRERLGEDRDLQRQLERIRGELVGEYARGVDAE